MNSTRIYSAAKMKGKRLVLGFLLGVTLACLSVPTLSQPSTALENSVKAGYVVKFTQYTTWPTNVFASSNAPIVIGVLGDDPFGKVLDREASELQGNRPLEVRRVRILEAATQCHLVFISATENRNEAKWLEALRDKPILTVGESGRTIPRGGVIELWVDKKHVRFEVSQSAMERAGLKIHSAMRDVARNMPSRPDNSP